MVLVLLLITHYLITRHIYLVATINLLNCFEWCSLLWFSICFSICYFYINSSINSISFDHICIVGVFEKYRLFFFNRMVDSFTISKCYDFDLQLHTQTSRCEGFVDVYMNNAWRDLCVSKWSGQLLCEAQHRMDLNYILYVD